MWSTPWSQINNKISHTSFISISWEKKLTLFQKEIHSLSNNLYRKKRNKFKGGKQEFFYGYNCFLKTDVSFSNKFYYVCRQNSRLFKETKVVGYKYTAWWGEGGNHNKKIHEILFYIAQSFLLSRQFQKNGLNNKMFKRSWYTEAEKLICNDLKVGIFWL